jgi:hypothetical protein
MIKTDRTYTKKRQIIEKESVNFGKGFRATCPQPATTPRHGVVFAQVLTD